MAICLYDKYDAERRDASHHEYIADDAFPALALEADKRGYRKATLSEINASADSKQGAAELFCWRGGLWIKK